MNFFFVIGLVVVLMIMVGVVLLGIVCVSGMVVVVMIVRKDRWGRMGVGIMILELFGEIVGMLVEELLCEMVEVVGLC